MASNQTEILNAIETQLAILLPQHTRLSYSYDLQKNNSRNGSTAYGFGIGAGSPDNAGVIKSVTLDQDFFVVITESFVNRSCDTDENDSLKIVYNNIETVLTSFSSSKLGISSIILLIEQPALDEPEKIGENTISVKANFIIKHRKITI